MIVVLNPTENDDIYNLSMNPSGYGVNQVPDIATAPMFSFSKSKFNAKIQEEMMAYDPSILLPAIRYISPDQSVVVWERPPTFKTVSYTAKNQEQADYDQDPKNFFRIPVPWQVYILYLSPDYKIINLFMFYRNNQLTSVDNVLYLPTLPNFYANARLCAAALRTVQHYHRSLTGAISAAHDMVWSTGFNNDTVHAVSAVKGVKGNPLGKYAAKSQYKSMLKYLENSSLQDVISWPYKTFGIFGELIDNKEFLGHDATAQPYSASLVALYYAAQEAQV